MKVFGAPNRYIQGRGVIDQIGQLLDPLGERLFVFGDRTVLSIVGERISRAVKVAGKTAEIATFEGECGYREISRLKALAEAACCQVIVGVGGGKAADTAKALSIQMELPVVIVPTIASTDAPTSHKAVIYDENHVKQGVIAMKTSPSMVLVDTEIIARAPVRSLVAGIGDALSTKFEAEACWESGATNMFGGKSGRAALHLSRLCYDIIREHAEQAVAAVKSKTANEALEQIVEANVLLSGLGFESGGLAAAHGIHNGLTLIEEMNGSLHGEKVAFAVLAQMIMEKRDHAEILDVLAFYRRIGLPASLAELGLETLDREKLGAAIRRMCEPGSYIHNMPFKVDEEMVLDAILQADRLGRTSS
jgi:glycerol dehydrogenase